MPNWCRQKLLVGSKAKRDLLVKAHCPINPESGAPELDFNTIKPMPEELQETEFGSRSHDGLRLILTEADPKANYYGDRKDKLSPEDFIRFHETVASHCLGGNIHPLTQEDLRLLREKYKETLPAVESLGRKCIENVKKYGAMNWYEWAMQNWGTKWNACDTVVGFANLKGKAVPAIQFDTAWSPAIPAMRELSRLNPTIPMALIFADEQIGVGVGYVMMKGGRIDESGRWDDFSIDAFKTAFACWDCEDEYRFDPVKGRFVRKDWDEEEGGDY